MRMMKMMMSKVVPIKQFNTQSRIFLRNITAVFFKFGARSEQSQKKQI